MVSSGLDMGWFCREHAFHLYLVALSAGLDAEICLGHFFVRSATGETAQSVGETDDHAWCAIGEDVPVDISIKFTHLQGMEEVPIVFGQQRGVEKPWKIDYTSRKSDEEFLNSVKFKKGIIAYNEAKRITISPIELLQDPFVFLHQPSKGSPDFKDMHGENVFWQITYHCYRLLNDDAKPLHIYRDPNQVVKGIIKFNPEAKEKLIDILMM